MNSFKKKKRRLRRWVGIVFLAIVVFFVLPNWLVQLTWLQNLGYADVFWKIKITRLALFLAAFLGTLFYLVPNFRYLTKNLGTFYFDFTNTPFAHFGQRYVQPRQFRMLTRIVAGVFALFFAGSYYSKWDEWFRFIKPQIFEKTDPVFGLDIGFYVFKLPFYQTLQSSLITLVFFTTGFIILLYLFRGTLKLNQSFLRGR